MGDAKADVDTDSTNTFTYRSRCCSEFIIDKHTIRSDIYERGNASLKYPSWDSPVVEIIVYDDYLVYATAFGISKEVIKQLKIVIIQCQVLRNY